MTVQPKLLLCPLPHKACTHLKSDTTGLSAPLPPRALASGGEGPGVGGA
jgi:hypothetical protein